MSRRSLGHRLPWIDAALLSQRSRVIDGGDSIVVAWSSVSGVLLEAQFGKPLAVRSFLWDFAGSVGVALLFGILGRFVLLGIGHVALCFKIFHAFGVRSAHYGSKTRQGSECCVEIALWSALIDGPGFARSAAGRNGREATRGVGAAR